MRVGIGRGRCRDNGFDMIPLGTTCTLRRPLEHPVRVVVRGRTLVLPPTYDVWDGIQWHKDVPEEWLEVSDEENFKFVDRDKIKAVFEKLKQS